MKYSWTTEPVFCFSSDIDWASESVIKYSHEAVSGDDLKLTYFNTHPSPYLSNLEKKNIIKLLIHPNFLPGSSQGDSFEEVIDYCMQLVPSADGFRSHRYFEVNDIMDSFAGRGFKFVSNFCTRCEPNLKPLSHRSGMVSFPIFMEDGGYLLMDPTLNFNSLKERLQTPGIKIINFHPAHIAFNTPNFSYTRSIKDRLSRVEWNNIEASHLDELEHKGLGIRTIIQEVYKFAKSGGHKIASMHDLYEEYTSGKQ